VGVERVPDDGTAAAARVAMTPDEHRSLAASYFNAAWDLIDVADRTPAQDRDMVTLALASRQHWIEAGGAAKNLAISDWQVAHTASLAGLADLALSFAHACVERVESEDLPTWLVASAHEGLARAHAAAGDRPSYEREAQRCRDLLAQVDDGDADDRALIQSQLDAIPAP
jgi:hypothetical protein